MLLLGVSAASITVSGCVESVPSSETIVVADRLRDEDFGLASQAHAPMLAIGHTAREVIAVPKRLPITAIQTALFKDGKIEVDLEVAAVPSGAAIELDVIALGVPTLFDSNVAEMIAAGGRYIRLDQGWKIEPLGEGRMHLSVQAEAVATAVPDEQETLQLLFKLLAREPIPGKLLSRSFTLPPQAALEIHWGIFSVPKGEPEGAIELEAILRCGGANRSLLAETIKIGEEPAGWHVQRVEIPEGSGPCQLELTQRDVEGLASPFVVWGTPQILVRKEVEDLRVVLISLDTLRADHMSGYGYPRQTTPEIDRRLLARGVRFADAMTTIASTGIAHLSLFTGEFPRAQLLPGRLNRSAPTRTLAEHLQEGSFATAAFTEDGLISGPFGFWYGFDFFREYHVISQGRGASVFRDGIDYIRENRDQRFFLFLHTYKVHDPWEPTAATQDLFRDGVDWRDGTLDSRIPETQRGIVDDYDRTIVEGDRMVAGFLEELEILGLSERTLVVLVSDHGEAFGEHGILGHGLAAHQEQLQIPIVFRGPGIAAGVVREEPVGITDVPGTILDLAGLPYEGIGSSRSLAGLLRNESGSAPGKNSLPEQPFFFTRLMGESGGGFDGVRMADQKLVRIGNRCRVWELNTDPQENQPIQVSCRESSLSSEIDRYRIQSEANRTQHKSTGEVLPAISRDTEESLRALGYVD